MAKRDEQTYLIHPSIPETHGIQLSQFSATYEGVSIDDVLDPNGVNPDSLKSIINHQLGQDIWIRLGAVLTDDASTFPSFSGNAKALTRHKLARSAFANNRGLADASYKVFRAIHVFPEDDFIDVSIRISEGSIKFEDGKLVISFRGLGLFFIMVQSLMVIGGVDAGFQAIKKCTDVLEEFIPNVPEVVRGISDLPFSNLHEGQRKNETPETIIRDFLILSRDRKELTDLEEMGLDLDMLAREIGYQRVFDVYKEQDRQT